MTRISSIVREGLAPLVRAACESGLWDALAEGGTSEELAARTSLDARAVRLVV